MNPLVAQGLANSVNTQGYAETAAGPIADSRIAGVAKCGTAVDGRGVPITTSENASCTSIRTMWVNGDFRLCPGIAGPGSVPILTPFPNVTNDIE